jgi:glycosyltransferase involved in cell wall biosynthesis
MDDVERVRGPDMSLAAQHADLDLPPAPGSRMRWLRKIFMRSARPVTSRQTAFNFATISAIEDLVARTNEIAADASTRNELFERRAYSQRANVVASIRSEIVEIQLQLAHLRGAFSVRKVGSDSPTQESGRDASVQPSPEDGVVPGVNIFGDWGATTGLAQAARRLTVALIDRGGLDISVGSHRSGAPVDESRVPSQIAGASRDRDNSIELWMLNVNEMVGVPDELLRPPGRRTYAIGVWFWELPSVPAYLRDQIDRVDEIWVGSSFVKDNFERMTSRPVHLVPAVVPELRGSGRNRADFGIPDDEVVFLFMFDVNSMVARKNPGAVVDAFDRAFGNGDASAALGRARLVIKVLNLGRHPAVSSWLQKEVDRVGGVLIDDDLTDGETVDLLGCCDVYVSLHRSEGFGFGMAEAMALGKPVIATAYSGNLDFTTTSNSCQVGYRMTEISASDHEFDEGASAVYLPGEIWAEPDLDQASRWMRMLAVDPSLRQRIGEAGRATVLENHNADSVVATVRKRLVELAPQAPR